MFFKSAFVLGVLVFGFCEALNDLPASIPRCNRDSTQEVFDTCLAKVANKIRPMLANGVKQLSFPSLKPLVLPQVTLEQGDGATTYQALIKNLKVHGLENYDFKKIYLNFKENVLKSEMDVPQIYIDGIYHISGKILAAPIEGQGRITANITTLTKVFVDITTKEEIKNNVKYIKTNSFKLDLQLGKVTDQSLEGLFKDNEILAKATQLLIKDNLKEIVDTIKPAIVRVVSELYTQIYFKQIETIPFDKLFPLSKKQ